MARCGAPKKEKKASEKKKVLGEGNQDYSRLGYSEKDVHSSVGGLFVFPKAEKGLEKCGLRPFLTFYFEDQESYQKALKVFDKNRCATKTPYADTSKLMRLIEGVEL